MESILMGPPASLLSRQIRKVRVRLVLCQNNAWRRPESHKKFHRMEFDLSTFQVFGFLKISFLLQLPKLPLLFFFPMFFQAKEVCFLLIAVLLSSHLLGLYQVR